MVTADGYTFTWTGPWTVKVLSWPQLQEVGLVHGCDQPDAVAKTWRLMAALVTR